MKRKHLLIAIASLVTLFCSASPLFSQNQVLRRIDFSGATKVEKTSGVWIDGEYVGFLKELKGAGSRGRPVPQAPLVVARLMRASYVKRRVIKESVDRYVITDLGAAALSDAMG